MHDYSGKHQQYHGIYHPRCIGHHRICCRIFRNIKYFHYYDMVWNHALKTWRNNANEVEIDHIIDHISQLF